MIRLPKRKTDQLLTYLLKANTLLNVAIDSSDDYEIGIDGETVDTLCNLTDALKDKMDNINWL